MPDQIDPIPPSAKNMSAGKPLEVDVTQQSLRNYEVRTMEDDVAFAPPYVPGEQKPQAKVFPEPVKKTAQQATSLPSEVFAIDDGSRFLQVKRFLLGFFGVLLLGFAGIGIYWYASSPDVGPTPIPPPVPPTSLPPGPALQFDSPLIPVNKTLAFKVSEEEDPEAVLASIKRAIEEENPKIKKGDFVRLYLYANGKKHSLTDMESILGQPFPPFTSYLNEESYTLFYTKGEGDAIRFGLVASILNRAGMENALSSFEREAPVLFGQIYARYATSQLPSATVEEFFDNSYKGVEIRYINFGSPMLAFDYALEGELFLVAGSRETMFALIDRLKLR